jgi:hypothetical protein
MRKMNEVSKGLPCIFPEKRCTHIYRDTPQPHKHGEVVLQSPTSWHCAGALTHAGVNRRVLSILTLLLVSAWLFMTKPNLIVNEVSAPCYVMPSSRPSRFVLSSNSCRPRPMYTHSGLWIVVCLLVAWLVASVRNASRPAHSWPFCSG